MRMDGHRARAYPADGERLLTTKDVAELFGVSPATVRRLVSSGQLARVKVGGSVRFDAGDVTAFVEQSRVTATARPLTFKRVAL